MQLYKNVLLTRVFKNVHIYEMDYSSGPCALHFSHMH